MYRLLIVDDEVLVRIGIKNCINWSDIGFMEPYEASNGKDALSIIECENIDVVLTDIKMPEMDGIELIKNISKEPGGPEVIILSCYNEFEYVREAMRYGSRDFLFKPKMYPADIIKALNNAMEHAEERKEAAEKIRKLQEKVNEDISTVKESFLLELIEGKKTGNDEFFARIDELGTNFKTGKIAIILFRINNFYEITDGRFHGEQYKLKTLIREIIDENINSKENYEIINRSISEYVVIFIKPSGTSEYNIFPDIISSGKKIIRILKETLGLSVSAGLSKVYGGINYLCNAYNNAALAADKSSIKGDSNIVLFDNCNGPEELKSKEMMDLLNNVFCIGDYQYVENIKEIFKKLRNSSSITMDNAKEISVNIVNQLFKSYINHPHILCEIYKKFPETYVSIYKMNSITWIENYIIDIAEQLEQMTEKQIRNDIINAARYMKSRMSDPGLKLDEVASQVNISRNYFSRLFKETMGESFTDYLIRIRLEHARELYMTSDMKVYEIAEKVGYPNWRYFTKLFKKQMGKSLTSIRKVKE